MDDRLKTFLTWVIVIAIIIGLRLLADYALTVYPPPQMVEVVTLNPTIAP